MKKTLVSRRWFIGGAASFGAFAGCKVFADELGAFRGPGAKLKVGVVSDIHVLKDNYDSFLEGDTRHFEHALEYFRERGADAVMICGDMADKGLTDQLMLVSKAWYKVFPDDKAPDGRRVEKLFVYGNHDLEGQNYGPFAKNLYPDPEELKKHFILTDRAAAWEDAFHEKYERVYLKEINGYQFVGGQWKSWGGDSYLVDWVKQNCARLNPKLPLLFAQHPHPANTCYGPWAWGHDGGHVTKAFAKFPNLIAFSGHSHYPLTDERSIWQGAYVSVGAGSLRYPGSPNEYFESQKMPYHRAERNDVKDVVRDGLFVSVYDDRVVFERRDFAHDASLGADWVLPLPNAEPKPFAFAARAKKAKMPRFAAGATATAELVKATKKGATDFVRVTFPSAPAESRAFCYQATSVGADGRDFLVKGCIPSDYAHAANALAAKVVCDFSLRQLPSGQKARIAVRPMESFGGLGEPILSNGVDVPDWAVKLPAKDKLHLYLLVGQSNMAGRGVLTEANRIKSDRIVKLAKDDQWDVGEEPLHFDKKIAGAGLGMSFARAMADAEPDVTVGLIPCAVGGTSIWQWEKPGRDLFDNAIRRAKIAMRDGTLKGILWHQGESNASSRKDAEAWGRRFVDMIGRMRAELGDVPVVAGELGAYLKDNKNAKGECNYAYAGLLNEGLHTAEGTLAKFAVASAKDLKPNADNLHFDEPSLRIFGRRYAEAMRTLVDGRGTR